MAIIKISNDEKRQQRTATNTPPQQSIIMRPLYEHVLYVDTSDKTRRPWLLPL